MRKNPSVDPTPCQIPFEKETRPILCRALVHTFFKKVLFSVVLFRKRNVTTDCTYISNRAPRTCKSRLCVSKEHSLMQREYLYMYICVYMYDFILELELPEHCIIEQ